MLDYFRNLNKTAAEKQQEQLNAYLDGALSPGERSRLEAQLAQDSRLQEELEQLRRVKGALRLLPPMRAPRSFALDPALYGRPQPNQAARLYPFMRVATAMTAVFFVFTLAIGVIGGGLTGPAASPLAGALPAEEIAADSAAPAMAVEMAQEESAGDMEAAAEIAAEPAAEVAVTAEVEAAAPTPTAPTAPAGAETGDMPPIVSAPLRPTPTPVEIGETEIARVAPEAPAEPTANVATVDDAAPGANNLLLGLSTVQFLSIAFALLFIVLLVVTLLLRRRLI